MATNNHKQESPKEQINKQKIKSEGGNTNPDQQQIPVKVDSDMEPDEFLAPNADTDLPIDHHVANDSVLRGEDHADEKADNLPSQVKKDKANEGKK